MAAAIEDTRSARFALRCSSFAERWFPDSWVFAALAVIIVAVATLFMGAKPTDAAMAFGDGFWSLIPFTIQMAAILYSSFWLVKANDYGGYSEKTSHQLHSI